MDHATLETLRRMVRPITPTGALTLERASSVESLNREVERFHGAIHHAGRLLETAGTLDEGMAQELVARALQLARLREGMALAHGGVSSPPWSSGT